MSRGASSIEDAAMTERLTYYLLRGLFALIARLPWVCIHALCHAFAFLIGRIVGYRRAVIRVNLSRSFPEKSPEERRQIERDFYLQFAYNFISTPKLLHQSPERISSEHFIMPDLTPLEEAAKSYDCVLLALGHYGNWELFSTGQLQLSTIGYSMDQVYRPLKNKALDRLFAEQRQRFGARLVAKDKIARHIVEYVRAQDGRHWLVAMITDQAPGIGHATYFTDFLHQPTAVLDGIERLGRKYHLPIFYFDIERRSPIQFVGRYVPLYDPKEGDLPNYTITERYARLMEANIQRDPAAWLWSHKRWKRPLEHYPNAVRSARLQALLDSAKDN